MYSFVVLCFEVIDGFENQCLADVVSDLSSCLRVFVRATATVHVWGIWGLDPIGVEILTFCKANIAWMVSLPSRGQHLNMMIDDCTEDKR